MLAVASEQQSASSNFENEITYEARKACSTHTHKRTHEFTDRAYTYSHCRRIAKLPHRCPVTSSSTFAIGMFISSIFIFILIFLLLACVRPELSSALLPLPSSYARCFVHGV